MKKYCYILLLFSVTCFSQATLEATSNLRKEYQAIKIDDVPKIDGVLDDAIWTTLPEMGNFVMMNPEDGTPEKDTHRTKVKLAYTDEAIYVAAYMYDNDPNAILKQFSQRDNLRAQADTFSVIFNTYDNGINETKFVVTSAGTLADATSVNGRDDWGWSTVFQAEISVDDKGWYAEFKIPYAALRFPKKDEQKWGLQFFRQIKHLNETYSWNYVDRKKGAESQYVGLLSGIKNITPPTRLSFFPFAAVNHDIFDGNSETNFSAGMDVKYGISESFTLDATLIPDFGQAKFDDVRLNLGPFEQTFSENRQFFAEGVELFNKGNLFYSRRVGGRASGMSRAYNDLGEHETVLENPDNVKLLNSIKVSGRTKEGLGIGFFNSVTQETFATIQDTQTGDTRKVMTEPLSNYNILVLDQQFNNNSSIALVNTNVTREGDFRDANVTAMVYDVNNKDNSFNFNGQATVSQVNQPNAGNIGGFASRFGVRRTKGRLRYGFFNEMANETYNINDLGISFEQNFNSSRINISYENFEPTKKLNKYRIRLWGNHSRRLNPNDYVSDRYGINFFAFAKSRLAMGVDIDGSTKRKDYYEPREIDRFLLRDGNLGANYWVSTDFRKKFAFEFGIGYRKWHNTPENGLFMRFEPRYRFSDNFILIYEIRRWQGDAKLGYIDRIDDDIIIGQRDMQNLENKITASYNFNSRQALNLSFRNFWSTATYKDKKFFKLQNDGRLQDYNYDTSANDPNTNFNIWNLDLTYNWRFAPGSEAILLYRHQIFNRDAMADASLGDSFNTLFKQPIKHTLSLKIVYFLDYNEIKHLMKS